MSVLDRQGASRRHARERPTRPRSWMNAKAKTNGPDAFAPRPRPTRRGMNRRREEKPPRTSVVVHRAGRLPVSVAGCVSGASAGVFHGRHPRQEYRLTVIWPPRTALRGAGRGRKAGDLWQNAGSPGGWVACHPRMTHARTAAARYGPNKEKRMARAIAIVEDEPSIRANYVEALSRIGYDVRGFASRGEASGAFANRMPELVIIDIGLGDEPEGGFDLCRELRAKSATLPIIFLTARDSDFDVISGLRL